MADSVEIMNSGGIKLVSYGWELRLLFDDDGGSYARAKLGAIIHMGSEYVGKVEVEMITVGEEVTIEVGEILKNRMKKDGLIDSIGLSEVTDNYAIFTFTPYSSVKSTPSSPWSTINYASSDFRVFRGIHIDYYSKGDTTPRLPVCDNHLLNGVEKHWELPIGAFGWMYFLANSGDISYDYVINFSAGFSNDTFTHNHSVTPGEDVYIRVPIFNYISNESQATVVIEVIRDVYWSGAFYETSTTVFNVDMVCTPSRDFRLTLGFVDSSYLWRAIPFFLNNEATFAKDTSTWESYDKTKFDKVHTVRKQYKLTSDYLTEEQAKRFMLYGLSNQYHAMTSGNYTEVEIAEVRLLEKSFKVHSVNNEKMIQIECTIEFSKPLLIA